MASRARRQAHRPRRRLQIQPRERMLARSIALKRAPAVQVAA